MQRELDESDHACSLSIFFRLLLLLLHHPLTHPQILELKKKFQATQLSKGESSTRRMRKEGKGKKTKKAFTPILGDDDGGGMGGGGGGGSSNGSGGGMGGEQEADVDDGYTI